LPERTFELFDEYAAAYARGERPDAGVFLERAGEEAEELARLLDGFLAGVPAPAAREEDAALLHGLVAGESPLLALRTARGITREGIVDTLIERLRLDREKREKLKGYYHQLESGLLDTGRVDRSVFAVLAEALRVRVSDLLAWEPRPVPAKPAYRRLAPLAADSILLSVAEAPAEPEDEIDRLFRTPNLPT
jgi:transcriptional regulator with XRE-family HTH domain